MAAADKPAVPLPDPQPENAKKAVAMVRDDAKWVLARPDLNSTDGIKRNIEALWSAITRLAEYVDGDSKNTADFQSKPYQTPKAETERNGNHKPAKHG